MVYDILDSVIVPLLLVASDEGLHEINFLHRSTIDKTWIKDRVPFKNIRAQLQAYFNKESFGFEIPLAPKGTPFQKQVWEELCKIPYGELISYQTLANRIGNPKAVRAVGAANGKNPLPIVVPCHRVIGSNGKLTGFAGGLDVKQKLIDLETNKMGF